MDALKPFYERIFRDGNDERPIGHQLVKFSELSKELDSQKDYESKIEVLKADYPALFISFCANLKLNE